MGLAETNAAVNEKRVVLLAGLIRDRLRRRMRKLVGRSDDEFVEGVAGIEPRMQRRPLIRRRRTVVRGGRLKPRVAVGRVTMAQVRRRSIGGLAIGRRAQRDLYVDRFTCLCRQRLAQRWQVLLVDPFAEKPVWCFDRCGVSLYAEKVEWSNPCFKTD